MPELPTQIWSAAEWHAHTLAAGTAPAVAPESATTGIQFGSGAVVLGLLVLVVMKVKHKHWPLGAVVVAFALGTLMVGASGLFGTPGELVQSVTASASTMLGQLGQ